MSLDSAFAIAVIIFLTTYVTAKTEPLASKAEEQLIIDGFLHIMEGTENYKVSSSNGYLGLSLSDMADKGFINSSYSETLNGPSGTSYRIAIARTDSYVILHIGRSSKLCGRVTAKLSKFMTSECVDGPRRRGYNTRNTRVRLNVK